MLKESALAIALAFASLGLLSSSIASAKALTPQQILTLPLPEQVRISYIAPQNQNNPMHRPRTTSKDDIGFYKVAVRGNIKLNANIRNLQLGCDDIKEGASCDINIKHLAISGLPNIKDLNGTKTFARNRGKTMATLYNPYVEIAVKQPSQVIPENVVALRVGADQTTGLMSAGLTNTSIPSDDGIQRLSGFLRIASTTGDVTTQAAIFGRQSEEMLHGKLKALGFKRTFSTLPSHPDNLGITIPSVNQDFEVPEALINGHRLDRVTIGGVTTRIDMLDLTTDVNQIYAVFPRILGLASKAKVSLKQGSAVTNINLLAQLNQSLSMVHNIPLSASPLYVALQDQPMLWPNALVDAKDRDMPLEAMSHSDVAQRGWWLSLSQPINLGHLKVADPVDIRGIFPQMGILMSDELLKEKNRVTAPVKDAVKSLFGVTMTTPNPIIIDLGQATVNTPARLAIQNVRLENQEVTPNCRKSPQVCI